jgi:U3 small nucleolar RNA-associated protein 10
VREDHYLIKLITLKMISSLFDSLKERYIMQVQDVLPYVADLIEDSNERVSREAYKVMKNIEKITGEDLKNYLDTEA